MAGGAGGHWENIRRGRMFGVGGLLPGGQVALRVAAIRGSNLQIVVVVDVTGSARHVGMAVSEQKTCGAVVKFRTQPTVKRVARFAGL